METRDRTFDVDELEALVPAGAGRRIAVAGAHEAAALEASLLAMRRGLAEPVLVGDAGEIRRIAAARGLSLEGARVEDEPGDEAAAARAAELARAGEVQALLKGAMHTATLMRAGLRGGLRSGDRLLSHVTLVTGGSFGRPLLVTDAALTPYPTLEQRIEIVRNAVEVCRALGVERPRVAALSASEKVDEKLPCSVDAARLGEENRPGGALEGCGVVDGPMDLGAAIDPETARVKGLGGEVAGRADVLVVPDVVAGNLLGKAAIYLGGVGVGACVVGGAVPIAMVSRASPGRDKYRSILLALICAGYSGGDQP